MKCSIGIFAYNEDKNIANILEAILSQETKDVEIDEIIVVASGCTDKTVDIARVFELKDSRVKVLEQEKREGKVSAINLFLTKANNDIVLLESGDTIADKNTVEYLVKPFSNSKVGMTGAHPVPVDKSDTFMGFTTNLLWRLHHKIALQNPKMGEMVAFRKNLLGGVGYLTQLETQGGSGTQSTIQVASNSKLPSTAVDEAYIESIVKKAGYEVVYVPDAIVYNKGPKTVRDFLKQRRRIHAGHLHLKKQTGYEVSTGSIFNTFCILFKNTKPTFRNLIFTSWAIFFEAIGKILGYWDYYVIKKDHIIWKVVDKN